LAAGVSAWTILWSIPAAPLGLAYSHRKVWTLPLAPWFHSRLLSPCNTRWKCYNILSVWTLPLASWFHSRLLSPCNTRYCWQTPWLWDSKIAIHHIQEETATEDRIFIMNLAIVYKLYLGIKNIRFEESLSYSSIVPRRENNIKGIHWLWTSKWNRKAATHGFPIASSIPYVVEFGPIWYPTKASWSCHTS